MKIEGIIQKARRTHKHIIDGEIREKIIYWFEEDEMKQLIKLFDRPQINKDLDLSDFPPDVWVDENGKI